jgi:hypothetical protein
MLCCVVDIASLLYRYRYGRSIYEVGSKIEAVAEWYCTVDRIYYAVGSKFEAMAECMISTTGLASLAITNYLLTSLLYY